MPIPCWRKDREVVDEMLMCCRASFCQVTFVIELFKNSISRLATLSQLERMLEHVTISRLRTYPPNSDQSWYENGMKVVSLCWESISEISEAFFDSSFI